LKSIKKRSFVIIEDIISMNKEEELQLRNAINYTAHHKLSKIFCVTHTIYKTGIFSMLPLFHSIIFTSSASNAPIVRAALNYFKIEKSKTAHWLGLFRRWSRAWKSQRAYFFFDCTSMSFCHSSDMLLPHTLQILGSLLQDDDDDDDDEDDDDDDDENDGKFGIEKKQKSLLLSSSSSSSSSSSPSSGSSKRRGKTFQVKENMRKRFSDFFGNHAFQAQAHAIFSLLLERFGPEKINPIDLTISFRTKREAGGSLKKISTVDYIAELLTARGRASEEHRVLHNYISRVCVIPSSCIKNVAFLKD